MSGIAIIGIGCRLPGGVAGPEAYWSLLREGTCAISEIPEERWSLAGFYDPKPDTPTRSTSKWGGFLDDIAGFDPEFFGLSPREAEAMDPQQRLLLEVATEAVQDSGHPIADLRAASAGVFVGVSNMDYGLLQRARPGVGDAYAGTGTVLSLVANRLSNVLDLSGPSLAVDTACSSALVALDTACRHLHSGSCAMALAGGVNVLLDPRLFLTFSRAHMLSPSGRIRAFDHGADGFVRGEGAGIVVLKPEAAARADGDRIYAVIRATTVNQDGATGTVTKPSQAAQTALMRGALEAGGIAPRDLTFAEAHGTGTPVGDPIEAAAIGAVAGKGRAAPLPIGSSKTNIGHLEPAAGIAGLIKAVLALHKGALPPSLGFEHANPEIDFEALNLRVATELEPLPPREGGQAALVNAFGFGGTNACALLQGPPAPAPRTNGKAVTVAVEPPPVPLTPVPVPLSAPTRAGLETYAGRLAAALETGGLLAMMPLPAIAAALAGQRDHFAHRAVVLADSVAGLRDRLRALAEGRDWPRAETHDPPELITGAARSGRRIVFTATGQGGQWWAMGRRLLEDNALFRAWVQEFDALFAPGAGWSVIDVLSAEEADSPIHDAAITPAVMFALQTGLAKLWRAMGVTPDLLIGHSFGEVTAAYLSGAVSAEHVAHLVKYRGLIRSHVPRTGAMAAVGLGAHEIEALLPGDGSIEIGAYNAPNQVTLTGAEDAIDALIAALKDRDPNMLAAKLALDFAYHSSWFDPAERDFKTLLGTLDWQAPGTPVISTVTGREQEQFDADYWWRNLRRPVRYDRAVARALDLGTDTFVELGPQRTLSSMTAACAAEHGADVLTVSTLARHWDDPVSLGVAAAELYVNGVDLDWRALHGPPPRDLALPHIPWQRRHLWSAPEEAGQALSPRAVHPLLGSRDAGPLPAWSNEISLASHPALSGHRIAGQCLFPAACAIEMMRAAAEELFAAPGVELLDLEFTEPLALDGDTELQLRTSYAAARRELSIHGRRRGGSQDWTLHAKARVLPREIGLEAAMARPSESAVEIAGFYADARTRGYDYGSSFQGVRRIAKDGSCVYADTECPEPGLADLPDSGLQPSLIDACLQTLIALSPGDGQAYVPRRIDRLLIAGTPGARAVAQATPLELDGEAEIGADILIGDAAATPVIRIDGLRARPLPALAGTDEDAQDRGAFYVETFEPLSLGNGHAPAGGTWLVLTEGFDGAATALAKTLEGSVVHTVSEPGSAEACRTVLEEALRDGHFDGVIYALPLDVDGPCDLADVPAVTRRHVHRLTAFGKALATWPETVPLPPVWIATREARALAAAEPVPLAGVAQSALLGLARTLAMECPEHTVRLVDLDAESCAASHLAVALGAGAHETEIVLREGAAYVPRLHRRPSDDLPRREMPRARLSASQDFALRRHGPAGPESLVWQEVPAAELADGEARVEVLAAGLNFRDVMAVGGGLPEGAERGTAVEALGLEFSGVVRAVGPGVEGLHVGARVFGLARGALRRYVTLGTDRLHPVPAGLSDAEAAALPTAYLTAHYALNRIARIAAGERVLIHNASGGVGLAAVALAKRAGAEIFATAGSDEKRAHLRKLGVAHVMDSRNLDFADAVEAATGGAGVDIVLNTLSGPAIEKGLACLAPYGRFVELGKRDVYGDTALGLKALRANISFHVVDLAALIEDRPALVREMMRELCALIESGEVPALPVTTFAGAEVGAAFECFSEARHIGKVAVTLDDETMPIRRGLSDGAPLDAHGCYLITGGTRGFGLEVGHWLAERGAGRVVLASPSGKIADDERRRWGDQVEVVALDVGEPEQVRDLLDRLQAGAMPLRGIVHAAVAYDDALLADMTPRQIDRVLAPKVAGAVNLTRALRDGGHDLDFFVSFSSMAQVIGWPGQSNYAAANAALQALAHWQRAQGIPACCINWGVFGDTGQVARSDAMASYMQNAGWGRLANGQALAALSRTLDADLPALSFAAADWARLSARDTGLAACARLSSVLQAGPNGAATALHRLTRSSGAAQLAEAESVVRQEAGKVLRLGEDALGAFDTLDEAGLDSLSTFELKSRIEGELGLTMPFGRYLEAVSFGDMAALVCDIVNTAQPPSDTPAQEHPPAP